MPQNAKFIGITALEYMFTSDNVKLSEVNKNRKIR